MIAVSVLLPFHNAEATLAECLASIRAQELAAYEVLAVDDGSRDGSPALVRDHARRDPRIRVLRPGRVGLVAALNLGLAQARAPLVARMDADDRMHPQRLARQVAYLEDNSGIDVVASRAHPFPKENLGRGFVEYLRWQDSCLDPDTIAAEIYRESPLVHPTVAFRRRAVIEAGAYRDGPFPEDYELWLRLLQRGHRIAKLDAVLLDWRLHGGSLSRNDPRCSRLAFDRLRADYLARDRRLTAGRPLVFWGAGRRTRRRSDRLIERGHTPVAYVDIDPRKIGQRPGGIPVRAPDWLARRPRPLVLVYVANHGAPELIAARLERMGYRRGVDYLIVG